MHLKNFSLYSRNQGVYGLTPAYDLLSTALVLPEDTEELALTLNGRKRKLRRSDFVQAMTVQKIHQGHSEMGRVDRRFVSARRNERQIQSTYRRKDRTTKIATYILPGK